MEQWAPTLIMLTITFVAMGILLLPTLVKYDSKLVNFYWKGFWRFLALIAFIAGGATALSLKGIPVDPVSNIILTGVMYVYIAFVVLAWFHLCGATFAKGLRSLRGAE